MREITMHCSCRDQEVRVVVTDDPVYDGQASLLDSEIICLEIGEKCSGGMCPLDAQPAAVMDLRLARSGLDDQHRTLLVIKRLAGTAPRPPHGGGHRWRHHAAPGALALTS